MAEKNLLELTPWKYSALSSERVSVLMRRNKRWAASLVAGVILMLVLILPRREPGNAREYVSTWIGNHDYSPYTHFDGFAHFFQTEDCRLSSLQIFRPTKSLCQGRQQLLDAMSHGGRIGFDAPYQTRDCDMRWYSTTEICSILSRFNAIHLVGDSMMRHLAHGLLTFLREDLVDGARVDWRERNPDQLDCSCRVPYDNANCWRDGLVVTDTQSVWHNDPDSIKCARGRIADIDFQWSAKDPAPTDELNYFKKSIRRSANEALIFGHGNWDEFDTDATQRWVSAFEGALADVAPGYERPLTIPASGPSAGLPGPPSEPSTPGLAGTAGSELSPRAASHDGNSDRATSLALDANGNGPPKLFITPNAQGLHKEKIYIPTQNNIKLMTFERDMRAWLGGRGWDTLGMFNLTVQSVSQDGTHATMESNLVKSMMVLNWLDWISAS